MAFSRPLPGMWGGREAGLALHSLQMGCRKVPPSVLDRAPSQLQEEAWGGRAESSWLCPGSSDGGLFQESALARPQQGPWERRPPVPPGMAPLPSRCLQAPCLAPGEERSGVLSPNRQSRGKAQRAGVWASSIPAQHPLAGPIPKRLWEHRPGSSPPAGCSLPLHPSPTADNKQSLPTMMDVGRKPAKGRERRLVGRRRRTPAAGARQKGALTRPLNRAQRCLEPALQR